MPGKTISSKRKFASLDEKLLHLADRGASGAEMAEETDLDAATCMVRVRDMLEDRDWLTELERQKLNIMALQRVKNTLLERVDNEHADVEDFEAFIKATKIMSELLEQQNQITDEQLMTITTRQAQALVTLFNMAWDAAITKLQDEYPQVDTLTLTDTFHDGLRSASKELQVAL